MKTAPADQLPPHDVEAEAAALGSVLLAEDKADELATHLDLDHFYAITHQTILRALKCVSPINPVSLVQWLKAKGELEHAGGFEYVAALPSKTPSAANFPTYFESLEGFRVRRAAIADAAELERLARDTRLPVEVISGAARKMVEAHWGCDNRDNFTVRTPEELLAMTFDDSDCILGDRLLAVGQSLVIAGQGGAGKSRLALQLAAGCITGRDFVGIATHSPDLRWLILQVENNNRRLREDLAALRKWCGADWSKVNAQLRIHTVEGEADTFVSLDNEANRARISRAITKDDDVVVWDSLYNYGIGDLNTDTDMAATVAEIGRLTRRGRPDRCPVVIHHALTGRHGAAKATGFDRSGFARNSKVLLMWTRAQINIAPGSSESNDALVLSCGKNNNGKEFPNFAVRLNPQTMIYEPDPGFDFGQWEADLRGRDNQKPLMALERVRELCQPFMSKAELAKAITEDCGCYRGSAYRYIARAVNRTIRFNKGNETYSPKR